MNSLDLCESDKSLETESKGASARWRVVVAPRHPFSGHLWLRRTVRQRNSFASVKMRKSFGVRGHSVPRKIRLDLFSNSEKYMIVFFFARLLRFTVVHRNVAHAGCAKEWPTNK